MDRIFNIDRISISSEEFQSDAEGLELNLKPHKFIGCANEKKLFESAEILTTTLNSIFETTMEVDYVEVMTEAVSARKEHLVFWVVLKNDSAGMTRVYAMRRVTIFEAGIHVFGIQRAGFYGLLSLAKGGVGGVGGVGEEEAYRRISTMNPVPTRVMSDRQTYR